MNNSIRYKNGMFYFLLTLSSQECSKMAITSHNGNRMSQRQVLDRSDLSSGSGIWNAGKQREVIGVNNNQ